MSGTVGGQAAGVHEERGHDIRVKKEMANLPRRIIKVGISSPVT